MEANENTTLVRYLHKEAERLQQAITKAEKEEQYGRAAHHKLSLRAYQKFLENISTASGKAAFFFFNPIALALLLLLSCSSVSVKEDPALSGKIFSVELFQKGKEAPGQQLPYLLFFKNGKLYSQPDSEKKKEALITGFLPGCYSRMVDSSGVETTIIFAAMSKKRNGETLLWQGSITGEKIQGALHWAAGQHYKIFSFNGTLKYLNSSYGKF
ncbi:MAG: hypothetical protein HY063_03430 [Bacteroidetes bacterium]|nr:hypothetical protein [Bacteroidota bacterium]